MSPRSNKTGCHGSKESHHQVKVGAMAKVVGGQRTSLRVAETWEC